MRRRGSLLAEIIERDINREKRLKEKYERNKNLKNEETISNNENKRDYSVQK